MSDKKLENLRKDYLNDKLDDNGLPHNPFELFESWLQSAISNKVSEPTAMTLSTVRIDNYPSSRVVLLKGFSEEGFRFYTNYESNKGNEINHNSGCALNFFWAKLERQVRVIGNAKKLPVEISEDYFNSRPEESRVSAIISPQSREVPDREYLEKLKSEFLESGNKIIKPEFWGGYVVEPISVEFWQGRAGRLHDRILFELKKGRWNRKRLAP